MHARRSDGAVALMHTWTDRWGNDGPEWSHWEVLGTGWMQGSPTAVSRGPDRTDVFVRGGGGEPVHKAFANGRWGGWDNFGGVLTSSPSVTSAGPGHLDVYGIGTDQASGRSTGGTGWSARLSTTFGSDSAWLYGSHASVTYIRP